MKMDSFSPAKVGLVQVALELGYILLVVSFMHWFGETQGGGPEVLIGTVMLFLFTFSAAVMGLLVFGYPVYLFVKQEFTRAVYVLLFNFLYSFLLLGIFLIVRLVLAF